MSKDEDNKLTPKQENFVRAYIELGNASEAYRRAYDTENMTEKSVNEEASRLLGHPKITSRLQAIQVKADAKALLSLEEHMAELQRLRDLAKQNAQLSAAIKAEELRGKLRRFYVEQIETGGVNAFAKMSDEELDQVLAETETVATPPPRVGKNGKSNGSAHH